ncbi:hypothetical protein HY990_06905 [Candidatus Micrarchaeota archaeon]|nr:hypothetical protein [Candidatus Micrarchaeota archaeon]
MRLVILLLLFGGLLIGGCIQNREPTVLQPQNLSPFSTTSVAEEIKIALIGNVSKVDLLEDVQTYNETDDKARRLLGSHRGTSGSCNDTDGGRNYEQRGSTFVLKNRSIEIKTDFCLLNFVTEFYCNANNTRGVTLHSCPNGCSEGVCNPAVPIRTCNDSDNGKRYYVNGTTTSSNGTTWETRTDSCLANRVIEYYCNSDNTTGVEVYSCPDGCSSRGGACNSLLAGASSTNETCSDTDGGTNYNVKGTISYYDGSSGTRESRVDYCSGNTITEYYCRFGAKRMISQTCTYGCNNGACNPAPSSVREATDLSSDAVTSFSSSTGRKLLLINDLTPSDVSIGGSTVNFPNYIVSVGISQTRLGLDNVLSEVLEARGDTCTADFSVIAPDSSKTSVDPVTLSDPETDLSYRYFALPTTLHTPYYVRIIFGTWDSSILDPDCFSRRFSYVRTCGGTGVIVKGVEIPIINQSTSTTVAIKMSGFVPNGDLYGSSYCSLYGS